MIRRSSLFDEFEESQTRRKVDHARNLRIASALLEEAWAMGVFPLKDPLEGIEVDIKYARVIRVRRPA
jgi:hypothetical protein